MVSFGSLVKDNATVAVEFDTGDVLHVTYKPSTLSPAFMEQMAEEVDDDDPQGFAKLFCEVVTDWDLEGPFGQGKHAVKAGEKVPLKPEVVSWVPTGIMRFILQEIGEDSAPKGKKKNRSSRR